MDDKLKSFEWVIQQFNSRGKWIISKKEVKEELVKLSEFDNFPNLSQWINNVFQRYERSGQAAKTSIKATYFAFIKEKYVLFNELINTINKLNSLSHEEVSKIYSKESLYSTIIENSTLTDYNLEKWILMILK